MFRTGRQFIVYHRRIVLHAKSDQNDMPGKHKLLKEMRLIENFISLKNTKFRQFLYRQIHDIPFLPGSEFPNLSGN